LKTATRRLWGFRALLVCALPFLVAAGERPPGLGDVRAVRTWSYPAYTRVVVELSRDVELPATGVVRLAANAKADRPERLYLDIPGIWVGVDYDRGVPVGDGLLRGVRLGQNTLRTTRLVIDLERYDRHRIFTVASPARVVIDVFGSRRSAPRGDPSGRLPAGLRRVQTIIVDPGHGGSDPGATGIAGLREKDVNLEIGRLVASRLEARGFDVVLTRDGDQTRSLEERTAIAESAAGDVFVSIHANSAPRASARGIETYTLDRNHERHSLDVAARENGIPAAKLDPLQRALAALQVDEVGHHSERLAGLVHTNVIRGARGHDRSLPDLGVKKGPFYVLFMSSMSSLLVETGFVTNRSDAALLRSAPYQRLLADRIAEGIDRYRQQVELGLAARDAGPGGRP